MSCFYFHYCLFVRNQEIFALINTWRQYSPDAEDNWNESLTPFGKFMKGMDQLVYYDMCVTGEHICVSAADLQLYMCPEEDV